VSISPAGTGRACRAVPRRARWHRVKATRTHRIAEGIRTYKPPCTTFRGHDVHRRRSASMSAPVFSYTRSVLLAWWPRRNVQGATRRRKAPPARGDCAPGEPRGSRRALAASRPPEEPLLAAAPRTECAHRLLPVAREPGRAEFENSHTEGARIVITDERLAEA